MASVSSALPVPVPSIAAGEMVLSRTYESSQLHTPIHLNRITIDNPHFQGHVQSKNVRLQKPKKMGDTHFFVQKDIPVRQLYSRTALKLSDIRPWDQIVEPPLKTGSVIAKELKLPFPREHPYASHTPQFTVFPDTQPYHYPPTQYHAIAEETEGGGRGKVHAQTQTAPPGEAIGVARPPLQYFVVEKTLKHGMRVERRYMNSSPGIDLVRESREMLWDYPASTRHKRAYTYPAPSFQYSRPPTTPYYLPPPSTTLFSRPPTNATPYPGGPPSTTTTTSSSGSLSRSTQSALNDIHSLVSRSTTYRDHFTPAVCTRLQPNSRPDFSLSSRLSQRPWTEESRGKYNTTFPTGPLCNPLSDGELHSGEEQSGHYYERESTTQGSEGQSEEVASQSRDNDSVTPTEQIPAQTPVSPPADRWAATAEEESATDEEDVETTDAATQTNAFCSDSSPQWSPQHNSELPRLDENIGSLPRKPIDSLTARLYKLPQLDELISSPSSTPAAVRSVKQTQDKDVGIDLQKQEPLQRRTSQPSISYKVYSLSKTQECKPAAETEGECGQRTPRTVESTRRMMQVFNRFSKSESLQRFRQHYQELAPDLRRHSIREGKRHVIHGTHAYYYH